MLTFSANWHHEDSIWTNRWSWPSNWRTPKSRSSNWFLNQLEALAYAMTVSHEPKIKARWRRFVVIRLAPEAKTWLEPELWYSNYFRRPHEILQRIILIDIAARGTWRETKQSLLFCNRLVVAISTLFRSVSKARVGLSHWTPGTNNIYVH